MNSFGVMGQARVIFCSSFVMLRVILIARPDVGCTRPHFHFFGFRFDTKTKSCVSKYFLTHAERGTANCLRFFVLASLSPSLTFYNLNLLETLHFQSLLCYAVS